MDILLRQVRIIDPSSPFHQQQADIFIRSGTIADIGQLNHAADRVIDAEGLCAAPGFTDVFAHFCDPGLEQKETLHTGANAAAAGGYTDVMLLPNTSPVVHSKQGIEYMVQSDRHLPVTLHPVGAVTKNAEGKELAEMYDMQTSGAAAFSDGTCSIQSPGILLKALQYVKAIGKTIIQLPDDKSIGGSGLVNEGIISTQLGLPGRPAIAEELMVARDIELVKYTGSRLHITGISTAGSLALIAKAKAEGIAVTCSVTPYHLYFSEEDLKDYDTNLKVSPPLRTKEDVAALKEGILAGTIDCIASHHLPQDRDNKLVEFEYAKPGMTGLETAFAVVRTAIPQLTPERLVALFSTNPDAIFGLPAKSVTRGAKASLTLLLPDVSWTPGRGHSRSANTAFTGAELKGKPFGIIHKDNIFLNQ